MANVELDDEIIQKLVDNFNVSKNDVLKLLVFFNDKLKPAIKTHYLSHLVSSIEEMVNENEKENVIKRIKEIEKSGKDTEILIESIKEKRIRLFTINLKALKGVKRKAQSYKKMGGVMIYYADYLQENEKRFAIAHELGHIVNSYLLHNVKNDASPNDYENYASLFAFIALLDKNNFYQKECKKYVLSNDIELFNSYNNLIHIKK